MASAFWDAKSGIMVDCLAKGETINSLYYCTLLRRLHEKIKEKRPEILRAKVLCHRDNARVQTSICRIYRSHS